MSEIREKLLPFYGYPAKVLSMSTRVSLSKYLNPEQDCLSSTHLVKDWRGVAEFMEFSPLDIENFMRDKSPTYELLRQWASRGNAKIGVLLDALEATERYDILEDESLVTCLERDCVAHQKVIESQRNEALVTPPIQDETVSSQDEERYITVGEAETGVEEHFDAFVCYTTEDFDFVRQMMYRLEKVEGLKLCITHRDLMPGASKYVIMAKLIEERCRKMIIVLSPDYINSKECVFQTRFAHALSPGAQQKKLIPVIYRPCKIPSILNHICYVDYTRINVEEWFWGRLANSLKAPPKDNLFTGSQPRTRGSSTFEPRSTTSTGGVPTCFTASTSTAVLPLRRREEEGGGGGGVGRGGNSRSSPPICPGGVPTADDPCGSSSNNSLSEAGSDSWTDISLVGSSHLENSTSGTFETSQTYTPGYDVEVLPGGESKKKKDMTFMALLRKLKR